MMHEYQIQYVNKRWIVFHTEFGLIGEFPTFDEAERFISWNQ
jgi:hypothetical protein